VALAVAPAAGNHLGEPGGRPVAPGLTQSILRVGNLVIGDRSGGPEMFWFGLANPKEVQEDIERRRLRR